MKTLNELCNDQRNLDYYIASNKNIEDIFNRELYYEKTKLSLLVEIGEFANVTRCFKYWSDKGPESKDKILDEAADCLHFILRLFLFEEHAFNNKVTLLNVFKQYNSSDNEFLPGLFTDMYKGSIDDSWSMVLNVLCCICVIIGYSAEDLEEAYHKKHKENYKRQESGY